MTALGVALLLIGAVLVVAEAHVPGGVLGVAGGLALIAGGIMLIAALGGGAAIAVPVGLGLGAASAGWALVATRSVASARRRTIQSGAGTLRGKRGVVRCWDDQVGQVFVDGALWRASNDLEAIEGEALHTGDPVVVEHVRGLTLSVRRAEDWE
jgi:membrane-bound serine protease (ClpP class)